VTAFTPSRPDGRSDRMVLFDLVRAAPPETLFQFDELVEALSEGLDVTVDRPRVYRAVAAANRTLLSESKRYLNVVRGEGYRVIRASEHVEMAVNRKDRAQAQIQRGIEVLRGARLNELSDNERALHEGQLRILSGLYFAVKDSERRHERSEALIADLTQRIDKLEGRDE